MDPQEEIENGIEHLVRQEVIRIVEADGQDDFSFKEGLADLVEDLPGGTTQRRREVSEELEMNPGQYREEGLFALAVHIDRDHPFGGLFHFGKDSLHAVVFPVPGSPRRMVLTGRAP